MPNIYPFACYCVDPAFAEEVVTPPYDAFSPGERAAFARDHPGNYLNVMRSPDEFAGETPISQAQLFEMNRNKLRNLFEQGRFHQHPGPCLYLYRLISEDHEQTGLVCEISVDVYQAGQQIKVHEQTRKDKEDQLLAYLEEVGAASSPVCCTYRHQHELDSLIQDYKSSHDPLLDFQSLDGVRHTIWQITNPETIDRLTLVFAKVPVSFLTDGHHRAAVARRYAQKQRKAREGKYSGNEPFNSLLVAFFPDNQLKILPYNRCVKGLNRLSTDAFLKELETHFRVRKISSKDSDSCLPDQSRRFSCLLKGQWYDLVLKPEISLPEDPVQQLDVSILHRFILEPILGITEARTDPRIHYLSGVSGKKGMEASCSQGFDVAFACFGTSVEELIEVAEAGQVMPPKSTWFEPKVRSGLFLRMRNS